jgi:hypothetical protein
MASLGGGVKEVESAAEDLAFLESLSPGARGGRIYGTLERRGDERTDTGERLPGVEIRILNKTHSTTAVTEIDGHFSADGLPAGTYELVPELPPALVVWDATSRIIAIVADGGCAESHILARSEGRVRGVLRDADGKPLQYSVTLLPMDVAPDSVGHVKGMGSVSTDADGVFDFRGRAPGRYYLGVNLANGPGPYVPTYYPGTPDRSAAVPIDVRRGETIDGLDFSVPPQRATGRLELRVESDLTGRFEICTSAPDTMVVEWSTFEIEAGKTLSIEVFDGVRYRVQAHVRLAGGRHLESDWHEIVASTDTTAVTLLPDAPRDLHPHPR